MSNEAAADALPWIAIPPTRVKAPARESEALGFVRDPDAFFDKMKNDMFAQVGDLSHIQVPLNRILVMVWVRPEMRGSIILTAKTRDEDVYQGVSGLVLKLGPHCYEPNDQIEFRDEDRCRVGDWVMYRRGEGFRLRLWKQECVMLHDERSIKMILRHPDAVF